VMSPASQLLCFFRKATLNEWLQSVTGETASATNSHVPPWVLQGSLMDPLNATQSPFLHPKSSEVTIAGVYKCSECSSALVSVC